MPKESIETCRIGDRPAGVIVSWGRGTQVQIATAELDVGDSDRGAGIYTDVDRDEINHIIKVLRKARDQAYGADE